MMRRLLLALLAAGVLAGCSKDKVREPTELKDIENPALKFKTEWTAHAGNGSGDYYGELGLTLADDALYAADVKGRVYALDPASGKTIWRAQTGKRVISGPTVSGNAVFVGSMDGHVIALKRADGTDYWRTTLSSEVLAPPVSDGTLTIARAGDGKIYALSSVSGTQVWMFDRTVPNLTLRGLGRPEINGSLVFVGMDNGRVAGVRMADGQAQWEQLIAAPTGRNELERLTDVDATLLLDGSELFAASFGGEIVCLDGDTGQVLWRRSLRSYTGMARVNDLVIVTDESGVVWGLDARTGAAAWKNEDLLYRKLSPPAVFADQVVVGDFDGYLHWLDPKDGRIVARGRVGSDAIRTAPVAGADTLYVMNVAGRINAIQLKPAKH
jgi:outer membrane protein assembly factor BamB